MPQPVSVIERLSARGRVRYGRFHCTVDELKLTILIKSQALIPTLDSLEMTIEKGRECSLYVVISVMLSFQHHSLLCTNVGELH